MPFRVCRDADSGIVILKPSGSGWVREAGTAYAALHAANGPVAGHRIAFVGSLETGFRIARKLALEVLAEGGRAFAFSAVDHAIEWLRTPEVSGGIA